MTPRTGQAGIGLIDTIIATGIVVTALSLLAGLASVALRTVMTARDRSLAVIHAHSKLDALRASPHAPAVSPSDALERDVPGWVEYLDAAGLVKGTDPGWRDTVFVRRWRISLLDGRGDLRVLAVRTGRCAGSRNAGSCDMPAGSVAVSSVRSEHVW